MIASSIFNGMMPIILSNSIIYQYKSSLLYLIFNKFFKSIYLHAKDILIYPITNLVIKNAKQHSLKTLIATNKSWEENLGKIKRLPENLHRIINSSINILPKLIIITLQIYLIKIFHIRIIMISMILIYTFVFYGYMKIWTNIMQDTYDKDNQVKNQSLHALKHHGMFQISHLFSKEINEPLEKEYKAYNYQNIHFRTFFIISNIVFYTLIIYMAYFFNHITSVEIISLCIFAHQTLSCFNLTRNIIGNLIGIQVEVMHNSQSNNIPFHYLSVDNISFSYSDAAKNIIHNFSLTLQNHWIKLSGSNGSGKTTLCKLISGQLLPTKGSISTHKTSQNDANSIITLTNETQHLWQKHVYYKMKELTIFKSELDMLKNSKLWHQHFSKYTHLLEQSNFSSGEHNFLSIISISLLPKPWLIILDESLDCIDSNTRADLIQFLKQHYPNVIITSHISHFELSEQIFDQIMTL